MFKIKLSKYTTKLRLEKNLYVLYNTLTRECFVYSEKQVETINDLLATLNRSEYTSYDAQIIQELARKGIVVSDDIDEMAILECRENQCTYQNNVVNLTIYMTTACNFRCTYCTQPHEISVLEDDVYSKVFAFINAISSKAKMLKIMWFGGEPLLQFDRMTMMMREAIKICKRNQCRLISGITTNGYLLDECRIKELKALHVDAMQITVDVCPQIHNQQRILANGEGTYNRIVRNICEALKQNIKITLRMNVDRQSFKYPVQVLDDIPQEYRSLVSVSVSNIFQEKKKASTYTILLKAIQMGYEYGQRRNHYGGCQTCGHHSFTIDTKGNVLFCTNSGDENNIVGKLRENGTIQYNNLAKHQQMLMTSARDNEACVDCIELPICTGRCRLARIKNNRGCMGAHNDGLSLVERARLDYYYDSREMGNRKNL